VKSLQVLRHAAIVAVLTLASIAIHEFGHFAVYELSGTPVHVSLQSVRPVGSVTPVLDGFAKAAGPGFSVLAAVLTLIAMRRRVTFFRATVAFTNASLRLFPCVMDVIRAVQDARPFSDEGDIALSWTGGGKTRLVFLIPILLAYLALTVAAGRRYDFPRLRFVKVAGVYVLSVAVGITVVIVDELIH
jgi:hypothetical protein